MNIQKFTQKSIEAIQNLEKTAYDFGNQEVTQEHLLYNLVHQEDSLILKLVEKMGISAEAFSGGLEQAVDRLVKVQGGKPYIAVRVKKTDKVIDTLKAIFSD